MASITFMLCFCSVSLLYLICIILYRVSHYSIAVCAVVTEHVRSVENFKPKGSKVEISFILLYFQNAPLFCFPS